MTKPAHGLLIGAGLAAVIFASSLALGRSGSDGKSAPAQPRSEPQAQFTPTANEPCAGAIASKATDSALASRAVSAGFRIYLPNDSSASAEGVRAVWWCPRSSSVRVEFKSGVILSLESGSHLGVDIASHWSRVADQGDGNTIPLSGGTALVHKRDSADKESVNSLQFVTTDGTWISLRGTDATDTSALEAIAESFKVDAQ